MKKANDNSKRTYSYKTRKDKVKIIIVDDDQNHKNGQDSGDTVHMLDGMDSICRSIGERAVNRSRYYDNYDFKSTDPQGSYTGIPINNFGERPVQDVDDL